MIEKRFKYLKIGYLGYLIAIIGAFIITFLYAKQQNTAVENYVALQRWAIIITLFGIFASLKYLHPKIKKEEKNNVRKTLHRYSYIYILRLLSLLIIYSFNLSCYIITSSKNFIFLAFICIFAVFLCAPNKSHIEITKITESDNNTEQQ